MNIIRTFLFAFFLFCLSAPTFATDKVAVDRTVDRLEVIEAESVVSNTHTGFNFGEKKVKIQQKLHSFVLKTIKKIMPKQYERLVAASPGDGSTAALMGMIFGIAALVFLFVPYLGLLGILLAPTSVILSGIALGRVNRAGNTTGLVQSILGLVFGGIACLIAVLVIGVVLAILF